MDSGVTRLCLGDKKNLGRTRDGVPLAVLATKGDESQPLGPEGTPGRGSDQSRDREKVRKNVARRRNRLRHQRQVVCLHWWGGPVPLPNLLPPATFLTSHG